MSTTRVSEDLKHIRIPLDDIGLDDTLRFALSPDYIIATVEKKILVYSSLDFRLIRSLECGKGRITGVDVHQNVLVTCLIDRSIHIWDLRSGKCLHTLTGYIPSFFIVKPELVEVEENSILAKEKWPRQPLLVTSGPLKSWVNSIWSLNEDTSKNPELLYEIYGQPFLSTGFAAKGRTAATAGYDCTVRVWDLTTGECKWVFIGHTDRVNAVGLDSGQAYSGSEDNTVRIWDIQTGECRHILKSHTAMVSKIRALPSRWVSLSGNTLCVWDPISSELRHHIPGITITGVSTFQHDNRRIVLQRNGSLELHDIHSNRLLQNFPLNGSYVQGFGLIDRFCVAYVNDDVRSWIDIWEIGEDDGSGDEQSGSDQP